MNPTPQLVRLNRVQERFVSHEAYLQWFREEQFRDEQKARELGERRQRLEQTAAAHRRQKVDQRQAQLAREGQVEREKQDRAKHRILTVASGVQSVASNEAVRDLVRNEFLRLVKPGQASAPRARWEYRTEGDGFGVESQNSDAINGGSMQNAVGAAATLEPVGAASAQPLGTEFAIQSATQSATNQNFSQALNLVPATANTALAVNTQSNLAAQHDGYGPLASMGQHIQIRAADGYRAGVIKLKNGMFLVFELDRNLLEPEFGMVPMLAPMVLNAAREILSQPGVQDAMASAGARGAIAVQRGVHQLTHRDPHRNQPQRDYQHRDNPPRRPAQPAQRVVYRYYNQAPPYAVMPPARPGMAPQMVPQIPPYMQQNGPPNLAQTQPSTLTPYVPYGQYAPQQLAQRQIEAPPWADEREFAGLLGYGTGE